MVLYLDTSSLIKLYVDEAGSELVRAEAASATALATSVITFVEATAAFARLRRERVFSATQYNEARLRFEQDWLGIAAVAVTGELCREAAGMAVTFQLRALDSLHLASFAKQRRRLNGGEVRFSSFDRRLTAAAAVLVRQA